MSYKNFDCRIEDSYDPLEDWDRYRRPVSTEPPHPYLCVQHGGSDACEQHNVIHGFNCPRCDVEMSIHNEGFTAMDRDANDAQFAEMGWYEPDPYLSEDWSVDPYPPEDYKETVNWKKEGF